MKAHQFISALDDARYGNRRLREEDEVASSPSHAPTSTAQWKTPSSGKSKDEGERTGGSKDAIKKSETSIPAPVAKAPSHAPTSTAQWKTSGDKSEDEGEKIDKSAIKDSLIQDLIDADDEADIAAIMAEADLIERGGHKSGCQCGFCKNKGSFGKKKEDEGGSEQKEKDEDMEESLPMPRRPMSATAHSARTNQRPNPGRMGFRHPMGVPARPKALTMAPYQPSTESLDTSSNPRRGIKQIADRLLEAPPNRK